MLQSEQREFLLGIYQSLKERGYNPVGQLIGYILTEDPTYITNHNNARHLITEFDRDRLLADVVEHYFEDLN